MPSSDNVYETQVLIDQYLHFHYGEDQELLPYDFGPKNALAFPTRCVTECFPEQVLENAKNAIDIGCAVGRSSFELAKHCEAVTGIDYSHAFIETAQHLQSDGEQSYSVAKEGIQKSNYTACIDPEIDRNRISFQQGDAMELDRSKSYDLALLANLLCRLPDPMKCLNALPEIVNPGGTMVICTPCTWLEEFTPKEKWLGGKEDEVSTLDSIKSALDGYFELIEVKELPFLIKEHARKYQWSVSQASIWQRNQ